ncbi:hypothetical protein HP397_01235 [Streptobacillus felis]|uniref:Uncharacterized protein n=1 Tax=Streptobacillus felis TaxID=1384509 RepID=A0A7Z0PET4_9FUSO|nr:hypothetical protein [Streptobacillus felis]NYV27451.1 hypothetical protein [Streptobacillus felis]
MKKIAYVGTKINFDIYRVLHNRIKEVKNLDSEIFYVSYLDVTIDEFLKEYDAVFFEDNLYNKQKFDFYFNVDGVIQEINLKKLSFIELMKYANFKIENSNILILETNEYFKQIYEGLKELKASKFHISSIKQNNSIKLDKGDYFKNFLDIERLSNLDLIINLTDLGNIYTLDQSPLKNDTNINSKYVLDLVKIPIESTFLKQFKSKGANIIYGIDLSIIEMILMLLMIFDRKDIFYNEFIKQLHVFVDKKINPRPKNEVEEINTSKEFLKLLKGNI